ncbi:hypothetical protein [Mycobacterium sp. OTB74]|uniref:hypothetical protein n=1 Tax=Mycobacterium sp. OTB74 TaxID=1853452 RepID=UPI002476161E|nr:hypothetical protein [Mycobacterium sp. OTB74]
MILGLVGLPLAPGIAEAQPAIPPVLPWMPGPPVPVNATPGSYTFAPNIIAVPPPAGYDARGVRAAVTSDPSAAASGLPGSALGLSPNKANALTSSSSRYRIGAGLVPNPSLPTVNPGMNIGAGMEAPVLEDPGGAAPKTAPGAESSVPTNAPAVPGQPAPNLEAASGTQAPATPSPTPTPASGPPPVEVPAAS